MQTRFETIKLKFIDRLCNMSTESRLAAKMWDDMTNYESLYSRHRGWAQTAFGLLEQYKTLTKIVETKLSKGNLFGVDESDESSDCDGQANTEPNFIRIPDEHAQEMSKEDTATTIKNATRTAECARIHTQIKRMTKPQHGHPAPTRSTPTAR